MTTSSSVMPVTLPLAALFECGTSVALQGNGRQVLVLTNLRAETLPPPAANTTIYLVWEQQVRDLPCGGDQNWGEGKKDNVVQLWCNCGAL